MRFRLPIASLLLFASFAVAQTAPNTLSPQERAQGWQLIWDGSTTHGWRGARTPAFPADRWQIQDGSITVLPGSKGGGNHEGDIITDRAYTNFELSVDFKVTRGANSGIKYFVDLDMDTRQNQVLGFEYQVLDDDVHPDAKLGINGDRKTASLYDILPAAADKPLHPVGEWNTAKIVVRGSHGEHWLNGVKVLEYDRNTPDFRKHIAESKFHAIPGFGEVNSGHLLLQDHGDQASFRNLKVRELK